MKNNSKRIAAAILAFCITAGAMPAIEHSTIFPTAYAAEAEDGGKVVLKDNMLYTEYSDHISLLYCEPEGEILIIPDMIDGKPVTEIDEFAFIEGEQKGVDVPALPESVKRVVIPESVERIGVYAFSCSASRYGLEEVLLPETLKEIGSSAFSDNTRLNVYGLSPNTVLGSDAFNNTSYNVTARANYMLKDNMLYTEYDDHIALAYCEPEGEALIISDMIDGKPVTEIDEAAFSECMYHGYEMPGLPGSVRRIVIPESVERIGDGAFIGMADHSMIEEVLLPETLKEVGDYAFTGHTRLNVYGLSPNTVLGKEAFEGTRYNVQERSNFIQKNDMVYVAYEDHIALIYCEPEGEALIIPDMIDGKPVTEIADYAFTENSSSEYDVPALPSSVKKVCIPEGVEVIGENAFANDPYGEGLYEVYLPSTLKKVGEYAFLANNHLNVYGLPETAEIGKSAFDQTRYDVEQRINLIIKNGMMYLDYPDHIAMIYCEPDGDNLYIPDMVDGKPVTAILGEDYIYGNTNCRYEYEEIPSLPDTVKTVYIPEGVEVIGENAFANDPYGEGLYEVYLPSTLKKVGEYAFLANNHLNVYGLPETAEIGKSAFDQTRYDVEQRINLIIKNGMMYLDYPDHIAMVYCEPEGDTLYIPDIVDGKPVTAILGEDYIYGNTNCRYEYEEIPSFPDTVKTLYIPEGVEVIEENIFVCDSDEEGLYEVYLPSTLKKVGRNAFFNNRHLNVYGLPETAEVDSYAFVGTRYNDYERSNFTEKNGMVYTEYPDHILLHYCEPEGDTLYIPDMIDGKPVTEILGFNYTDDNNYDYYFKNIPPLPDTIKVAYVPEGVETIYGDSFVCPNNKEGLHEVYLPSTLKKMDDYTFNNNRHLNVYGLPEKIDIDLTCAFVNTRYDVYERSNIIEKNGMIYKEYPDHITIYYCEPEGDTLYIPDMIDGKPVTEINGFNAKELSDFFFTDDGIVIPALPESVKNVIVPEGVKVIEGAFAGTKFEGQFTTPVSEVMYGDANLDGKITLADSLAILQFIANEDKYPLSEQAQKNADCFNPGDGITGNDAVAVMRYDTKIVSKLPIIEK